MTISFSIISSAIFVIPFTLFLLFALFRIAVPKVVKFVFAFTFCLGLVIHLAVPFIALKQDQAYLADVNRRTEPLIAEQTFPGSGSYRVKGTFLGLGGYTTINLDEEFLLQTAGITWIELHPDIYESFTLVILSIKKNENKLTKEVKNTKALFIENSNECGRGRDERINEKKKMLGGKGGEKRKLKKKKTQKKTNPAVLSFTLITK